MNPDLEHLIVLQAQDLELQKLHQEQADLPRRVTTCESAHKAAEHALLAAQESLAREEKLRRSQEIDADGHRSKSARLRKQMDGATSAAQISALEHEINFAEAAIRKLEDEEIASLERTEELEASRDKAAARSRPPAPRSRTNALAPRQPSSAFALPSPPLKPNVPPCARKSVKVRSPHTTASASPAAPASLRPSITNAPPVR
jgi:hypothetical protein